MIATLFTKNKSNFFIPDWLLSNSSKKSWFTKFININKWWNTNSWCSISTISILSSIWISWLSGYSVINNIFKSFIHPSSVTAFISVNTSSAINKFLFWKVIECSSWNFESSFNGSNCRESPAWTTWSLVFDGIYCSRSSPINWGWNFNIFSCKYLSVGTSHWSSLLLEIEITSLEFFVGQISKLVHVQFNWFKS